MRLLVALGGNAVLTRSVPMTAEAQRADVRAAAVALADLASERLARDIQADMFVVATDVEGDGWGTPDQHRIDTLTPDHIRGRWFAAGSMGPTVEAAARFVEATGSTAAIGALADIEEIVAGRAGTSVVAATTGAQP